MHDWTANGVARVTVNPFYAITINPVFAVEHEPIIARKLWIDAQVAAVKEMGLRNYLALLLDVLEHGGPGAPE